MQLDHGRDWTEDLMSENGAYYHMRCVECTLPFIGHKRRIVCKQCQGRKTIPVQTEMGPTSPAAASLALQLCEALETLPASTWATDLVVAASWVYHQLLAGEGSFPRYPATSLTPAPAPNESVIKPDKPYKVYSAHGNFLRAFDSLDEAHTFKRQVHSGAAGGWAPATVRCEL